MKSKHPVTRKHLMISLLFALYMAEYMISLICMDRSSYALAGTGEILHYMKMPALAIGILLFPLSQRIGSSIRSRRIIMLVSNIIYLVGMLFVMEIFFPTSLIVNVISCIITLLALGFLGGAVYYYFAIAFVRHAYLGRASGTAGAAAFLIQMLVQYVIPADPVMLVLLLAGFSFTAYLTTASKERFEWMFDEPLEYAKSGDSSLPNVRTVSAGIAGIALIYLICGLTDTMIVSMNYAGDMSIYSWPRLFGAVGYLMGGALSDIGRRKWFMVSALCVSILSIPLPFMLSGGQTVFATCMYYVIAVAEIEFLNVFFWEMAPRTPYPQLFSGMSRVISCIIAVVLPLFAHISVMTAMIIEVFLITCVVLCTTLGGFMPISQSSSAKVTNPDDTSSDSVVNEDALEAFATQHGLTPREKELLVPLIVSDDEIQSIASDMNISARTVYRHINSIYEKTGVTTRYALMRYYYETK